MHVESDRNKHHLDFRKTTSFVFIRKQDLEAPIFVRKNGNIFLNLKQRHIKVVMIQYVELYTKI
jgi:hypothetical protein